MRAFSRRGSPVLGALKATAQGAAFGFCRLAALGDCTRWLYARAQGPWAAGKSRSPTLKMQKPYLLTVPTVAQHPSQIATSLVSPENEVPHDRHETKYEHQRNKTNVHLIRHLLAACTPNPWGPQVRRK